MEPVQVSGAEIDRCTECQGLWFDAHEDRDLRGVKGAEALDVGDAKVGAAMDVRDKIDCPRCRTRMVRMVDREQPHVWYEACAVCGGRFLDAGEFRDLTDRSIIDFFRHIQKGERPLS